ncbi:MAG TPA: hypothetical protein VE057_11095 [Archangium sp.]|nr:hypothetical protein [Archangium sp.]
MKSQKKTNPSLLVLHTLLLLPLVMLPGAAFADSTHISTGPVTNWSYGWKSSPTGTFTPFTLRMAYYGLPGWSYDPAASYPGYYPLVAFNNTNATTTYSGLNFRVPRQQLVLHPGNDAKAATVRWTADGSGQYQIQGLFNGLDTCPTSVVYIVLNSATMLFTQTLNGPAVVTFNLSQALSPNDTLDFIVDNGGNGLWCDTVGLSAMITSLY